MMYSVIMIMTVIINKICSLIMIMSILIMIKRLTLPSMQSSAEHRQGHQGGRALQQSGRCSLGSTRRLCPSMGLRRCILLCSQLTIGSMFFQGLLVQWLHRWVVDFLPARLPWPLLYVKQTLVITAICFVHFHEMICMVTIHILMNNLGLVYSIIMVV